MKKVFELLLCILHPIAVVLIWITLVLRRDRGLIAKADVGDRRDHSIRSLRLPP